MPGHMTEFFAQKSRTELLARYLFIYKPTKTVELQHLQYYTFHSDNCLS